MKLSLFSTSAIVAMLAASTPTWSQVPSSDTPGPQASSAARSDVSKNALLGRDVFSQDQTLMGKVDKVVAMPDGRVQAIMIKTGGFLGFGGKLVSIPEGKFSMRGATVVQLQLTSQEVQKLPEQKDDS